MTLSKEWYYIKGKKHQQQHWPKLPLFSSFWKEFQQILHTHSVQQQAQATEMKLLHSKIEMLQQASIEGSQTMQDFRVQLKEGKPFSIIVSYNSQKSISKKD